MQKDFHYFATFCAAYLSGYTHEESVALCTADQFVDLCTRTYLSKINGPEAATTTQLQLELADARPDVLGLQDITRIWSSFHFLPYDLYAEIDALKRYKDKYRLICKPNGVLVADTVKLAKDKGMAAAGLAMHVLADTWAHSNFAGTPSLVINNTNYHFFEVISDGNGGETERRVKFNHNPATKDDLEKGHYTGSIYQADEKSIMNLGHGRAGHLPDYSCVKYRYLPAWNRYREIVKDNPSDYMHAFCQMIYALRYLKGEHEYFVTDKYDDDVIADLRDEIDAILRKRQVDSCDDWRAFGQKISGKEVPDFDISRYEKEYLNAPESEKADTWMGQFLQAAISQKSMVTQKIFESGNMLAGNSVGITRNDDLIVRSATAIGATILDHAVSDAKDAKEQIEKRVDRYAADKDEGDKDE